MINLFYVALGGACGAMARFLLARHAQGLWGEAWPLGTLLVNVSGSLCIGIVVVLLERATLHPDWRSVLMVGFLGAFTTFSTFSLETVDLWQRGDTLQAVLYALGSTSACVFAAAAGIAVTRTLTA